MRRQHWLRGNKSTSLPNSCIWTDTETKERRIDPNTVEHRLVFGMACHQRTRERNQWCAPEWIRYTSKVEFWDYVESCLRPNVRLYIFAHNWAFDAPVLGAFDILPARGWKLHKCVIESPPVILTWRRPGATITMLDTLNWWRMPLKKIGESVSLPKLEMPSRSASKEVWNVYAQRDVEIIRVAVLEWIDFLASLDLGSFAPTLASQALRAFRHRFMDHGILIDDNPRALALARSSIHGGRTEAFRIGRIEGPVHVLDVNSMYPAVMRDHEYPTVLKMHCQEPTLDELTRWTKTHAVIARCRINTKRNRYAISRKDKVIFPTGCFTAELATPDIIDAIEHDELVSASEANVYDKAPLFRTFVDSLYMLRQQAQQAGNSVQSWLLKILMNSLYGKFAQRGDVWEICGEAEDNTVKTWIEIIAETSEIIHYRQFARIVQTRTRDTESQDSHPAIASHVTAYARANLWRLMQLAAPGDVYYCDTDSLFVGEASLAALQHEIDASRLGALKHEATYPWVIIRGLKDYETPTKRVIKGVKAAAVWESDSAVVQEQWSSLVGLLRESTLEAPRTHTLRKSLSRRYHKGIVARSGVVLPFVLDE